MLIAAGANVNACPDAPPIIMAMIEDKHKDVVKLLLEAKCDVNATHHLYDETALHMALHEGTFIMCD